MSYKVTNQCEICGAETTKFIRIGNVKYIICENDLEQLKKMVCECNYIKFFEESKKIINENMGVDLQ